MPRRPRLWYPRAIYHLVVRGNNREPTFFADADYRKYLALLKDSSTHYECRVFAYALMTNHVHLLVKTGEAYPPAKLMQSLNTAYTYYVRKKYHRVGHLFQGRYHATLVERDAYFLEVSRYIHLNPVRAGLVKRPERYPWSSYQAYLGLVIASVAQPDEMLVLFGEDRATQRSRYTQFVIDGMARDRLFAPLPSPESFQSSVETGARPSAQKPAESVLGV